MKPRSRSFSLFCSLVMLGTFSLGTKATAEEWRISKSSGDFRVIASGVEQASLAEGAVLRSGDNIQTGRNGRVLLVRGEESILISPNSIVGIPAEVKDGLSTTILQQAGSILLEVEKRNVKHFEVATPYLAAVVKGTQFRVTVKKNNTIVGVLRGQVEVTDFKTGKYALVLPGQTAKVSAQGTGGLSLRGSGSLSPIQQGQPRKSPVNPIAVPKEIRATPTSVPNTQHVRIASPLGEVKLDFHKVTKGLSHAPTMRDSLKRNGESVPGNRTDNSDSKADSSNGSGGNNGLAGGFGNSGPTNGFGNNGGNGGNSGSGNGNGNGGGNGNGNSGSNGGGSGLNVGPGNSGNGNGNSNGNGNGHNKGKGKH